MKRVVPSVARARAGRALVPFAFVPAVAGALAPKCPMCVAAWLAGLGVAEGAAAFAGPIVLRAVHFGAALAVVVLVACFVGRLFRTQGKSSRAPRTEAHGGPGHAPACCPLTDRPSIEP